MIRSRDRLGAADEPTPDLRGARRLGRLGRTGLWGMCALLACLAGCERPAPGPVDDQAEPPHTRKVRRSRSRVRAAAVTVRFSNSAAEPGSPAQGYDRLLVAAVFADADQRDVHLIRDLVGLSTSQPAMPQKDSCVRQQGPHEQRPGRRHVEPHAWLQLLDVGNLRLKSGQRSLPLRITMVPSLFSAIRGVRYDGNVDHARHWLAAQRLSLVATGGDGVEAFEAPVDIPRPVRVTHVGSRPVRGGLAWLPEDAVDLPLRWGSVDGSAELEVLIGAERGEGLDWLRCRLEDDGVFIVPGAVLIGLPKRRPDRPWLVSLVRSRRAAVPGFPGQALNFQLVDSVRVH